MTIDKVENIEAEDYQLLMTPSAFWPWRNFSPDEIRCKGTGKIRVNVDAMNRLQAMRDALGAPMDINCGYRSPEHNEALIRAAKTPEERPAKHSLHMKGKAFDISIKGQDAKALYAAAKAAGFTGFGFYRTFLHVDTGRAREWGAHKGLYV